MWKLIFIGIVVWLAIYLLKRMLNQASKRQSGTDSGQEHEVENMVQCAQCSVHLPRSEAFLVDGNFYCCKAHIPNK